jgi:hypothetical protein
MEFLKRNFYDTTTQIVVGSNTFTAAYLLTRDTRFQYSTDGFNNDATTASITIQFDQTETVDRIVVLGTNVKKFNIYYGGVTANAFAMTGPTTTSQWTQNSASSLYLPCTPVACTSVTFDLYSTQVANSEKAIGYILLSEQELEFPRLPSAKEFKITIKPKELRHELSDGGVRTHNISHKYSIKMKFKYLEEDFRDDLRAIYDQHEDKVFVTKPTTTSWDGVLFETNWTGPFDLYEYSDNAPQAGFSGSITLEET